jgi:hypothetical protein
LRHSSSQTGFRVMLSCNSLRQAQVCMALARASNDPALKQRYVELALKFVQKSGDDRDLANAAAPLAAIKPKFGNGNSNPHGR